MGRLVVTLIFTFVAFAQTASAADPQLDWSLFRGTSEHDSGKASAVDRWGNVWTVGWTTGAFPSHDNAGMNDGFLASYSHEPCRSFSAVQWGDKNNNQPVSVAVDLLGYVHVVGTNHPPDSSIGFYRKFDPLGRLCWENEIKFGEPTWVRSCISDGCFGALISGWASKGSNLFSFVRRYDKCGREVWTTYLAEKPDEKAQAQSLALHSSGDVLVAGYTRGRLDGEPTNGTRDGFVARLSHDTGTVDWIRRSKHPGRDYSFGVCADRKGRIYVAGEFRKSDVPVEPGEDESIDTDQLPANENDVLVTGYSWMIDVINGDGSHIREIKPGYSGAARDLVIARDGTLMVAGSYRFAQFNPDTGDILWIGHHGSNSVSVTRDNGEGVYLTGWAKQHRGQPSLGHRDLFVDKYSVR